MNSGWEAFTMVYRIQKVSSCISLKVTVKLVTWLGLPEPGLFFVRESRTYQLRAGRLASSVLLPRGKRISMKRARLDLERCRVFSARQSRFVECGRPECFKDAQKLRGLQRAGENSCHHVVLVGFSDLSFVKATSFESGHVTAKIGEVVDVNLAVDLGGVELGSAFP